MTLVRIRDRRTITLSNLSFAAGEATVINPIDLAYPILLGIMNGADDAWPNYLTFSLEQGVLDEDDYVFLLESTAGEVTEVMEKISNHISEEELGLGPARDLTEDQEADVQAFSDFLKGLLPAKERDDKEEEGNEHPSE